MKINDRLHAFKVAAALNLSAFNNCHVAVPSKRCALIRTRNIASRRLLSSSEGIFLENDTKNLKNLFFVLIQACKYLKFVKNKTTQTIFLLKLPTINVIQLKF